MMEKRFWNPFEWCYQS